MRYVFKFGGSSLSTTEKLKQVADFIKMTKERKGLELIVVVSAMGKTTNALINFAQQLSCNTNTFAYSELITLGENISAWALTLALQNIGVDATAMTAKDIKIHSRGNPEHSLITHIDTEKIQHQLNQNKVVIVTGFQGVNEEQNTLTLGRGGSDTTASALGHALNAKIKIFTDVAGYFTSDPNKNKNTKKLKSINIYSALELANSGAKVLDHRCLEIANLSKHSLSVLKSQTNQGTAITYSPLEKYKVDGISSKNKLSFVKNRNKKCYFLQSINQFAKIDCYLYTRDSTTELIVCDLNKLNLRHCLIKQKCLSIQECGLITIVGSGLNSHADFLKKVQNAWPHYKNYVYYSVLTPTCLKLVVKPSIVEQLTDKLINDFSLIEKEK